MMNPLIAPTHTWALLAILFGTAALGLWAERTRAGARLSAVIITLAITFTLSNLHIIPSTAAAYDAVWKYLVPLAIPLLLLNTDLRRLPRQMAVTLAAFLIGIVGTVAGATLAFFLVPLGNETWRLAASFSANYIGGWMNYQHAADATGLGTGKLSLAGMAVDNLLIAFYFVLLFLLPTFRRLRWWYHEPLADRWGSTVEVVTSESRQGARIHLSNLATALALSMTICAIGFFVESRLGWAGTAILIIAIISAALAIGIPGIKARLQGANELGIMFMLVLFAVIGAGANVTAAMQAGPALVLFAAIIIATHLVLLLASGKLLRLGLPELIIASNAGLGSPVTAAAMAATRRWHSLLLPAIVCGALGHATATYIGVTLGGWLR